MNRVLVAGAVVLALGGTAAFSQSGIKEAVDIPNSDVQKVLKNAPQQAGITINGQVGPDFVDELGAACPRDGTEIMNEGLD